MGKELLSFVIPCYRSEKTITSVVDEIKATLETRSEEFDYEIILVNDSSPDNVWSVIKEISASYENARGISLSKNFGQHAALMAGYKQCKGDIVITLDDDGQSPIDSIFDLVDAIHEGYDVVYGKYEEKKERSFRKIGSSINKKMSEILLNKPKNIVTNSFFGMRKFIAEEMVRCNNPYPYIEGLIMRSTLNITNVSVKQRERKSGKSGYTLSKLLSLWMNGFTAFSVKPLRIATLLGVITAFLGFIFGSIIIVRKIIDPRILLGYSSIMALLLFLGGLMMIMLGLIGEYIGRIYIVLNKSPQYVVKDSVNLNENTITDEEDS